MQDFIRLLNDDAHPFSEPLPIGVLLILTAAIVITWTLTIIVYPIMLLLRPVLNAVLGAESIEAHPGATQ